MSVLRNLLLNWVLPIAAFLALLSLVQVCNEPAVRSGADGLAPDFEATDTDGVQYRLSDLRGKKVLLNFWETWCGPCKVEIPSINRTARKHPDVLILGLASQSGNMAQLRSAKSELEIEYPVLKITNGVRGDYGVQKVPTTFLIDEQGRVTESHVGIITPITLGRWLR